MAPLVTSIPKPKNWQDFERASKVLFECVLGDPHTQQNGRSGQVQYGVDIYGQRLNSGDWVGIQCKGKDSAYGMHVTERELRAEVAKARKFKPKLSEFFLITTGPHDAVIQEAARQITDEERRRRRKLRISVWGWEAIELEIRRYEAAIRAFHPDANPFTDAILNSVKKTETLAEKMLDILIASTLQPSHKAQPKRLLPKSKPQTQLGKRQTIERMSMNAVREQIDDGSLSGALFEITSGVEKLPKYRGLAYRGYLTEEPVREFVSRFELGRRTVSTTFTFGSIHAEAAVFGNILFIIHSVTGRRIGPDKEGEIVFSPGTSTGVRAIKVRGEFAVVELEESAEATAR